ncbi:MAG TPA: LysM peptidoglycan-binding domain-containing protein [Actinomycetota bacterium]|nr:LysM peptidoglycan-binding domain-containing protein [Actinomycetota bacterium]
MRRTRVRRRRLGVLLAGALVVGLWSGPVANALGPARAVRDVDTTYVVRKGDTLWSIAARVAPGQDPRSVVDAIAAANDVPAGALVPGQTLSIPA